MIVLARRDRVETFGAPLIIEDSRLDQAFGFQPAQSAINRGKVDARISLLNPFQELIGSRMDVELI